MIKLLELFGGIGAPRKSLVNMGVKVKSIDYVEILPYAVQAYNNIFNNDYSPQDIKDWNLNVDLLVHGSPCQDWSKNGLNNVNSGRSILYERTLEIIEKELNPRPKVVIWENVTGLISKRHIEHFNHYLQKMEQLGYVNSFKVLNAKDFNIPQHRERIFTVSILGDTAFKFPAPQPLESRLIDYIDTEDFSEELQLSENEKSLFYEWEGKLFITENTKKGYREVKEGDSINVERPNSTTRRGRVGDQIVKTITTNNSHAVYFNGQVRKLSLRENWKLMGFSDSDFDRVMSQGIPKAAMQTLAGNSIPVPVLEEILLEVFQQVFPEKLK